jgi:hypothetical protein
LKNALPAKLVIARKRIWDFSFIEANEANLVFHSFPELLFKI